MKIPPKVKAWLVDVGERVASSFGEGVVAAITGGALAKGINLNTADTLLLAGLMAAAATLKGILAPLIPSGVSPASLVPSMAVIRTLARRVIPRRAASTAIARARIVVVNQTSKANVTNAQAKAWTESAAAQAHEFARNWGLASPSVTFATRLPTSNVDTIIVICDNADQAGALGYHSETDQGITYGRVFAVDCQQAGVSISSCLSHEVLEAVADLDVDRWVDGTDGKQWALEVCDPVESDTYTDAKGVELSNYVLPSFFDDAGHAPFDRLGRLAAAFTLGKGGYAVVRTAGRAQQVFGDKAHYRALEGWRQGTKTTPLSRTARRLRKH